jgi:hypothetical protein
MRGKRRREIFEECLSALLEGRRSIEESLLLYPSMAEELGPLLRMAAQINDTFQSYTPPVYVVERGRNRFLLQAQTSARAKAIAGRLREVDPRVRVPWGPRQWGLLAAAVAVGVVAFALGIATLLGDGGGTSGEAVNRPVPSIAPVAPIVTNIRAAQDRLKEARSLGGPIDPEIFRQLREATSMLQTQVEDPEALPAAERQEVEKAISESLVLLADIVDDPTPDPAVDEAREVLGISQDLAEKWGIETPVFTPKPTASPVEETPAPMRTPGGTPTPTPTAGPTPAPTPTAGEGTSPTPVPSPAGESSSSSGQPTATPPAPRLLQ